MKMNMKKILLALGVGAIGYFLWKKFSKKSDSTTKSFSGNDDFFSANGQRVLRNGGYYAFQPKESSGWRAGKGYYLDNRVFKINKDKENTIIVGKVHGRYFDAPNTLRMGYSPKLTEGIIIINQPSKYRGYIVPMSYFKLF